MPNRRPGGEWAWIFCIKPQILKSLKADKRLLKSFVNLAQSINVRNFSLSVVKLSKVGTYRKRGECHQQKGNKPLGFVTHQNFIETYSPAHSEDRFTRNQSSRHTEVQLSMPLGILQDTQSRNSITIQRRRIKFAKQKRTGFSFQPHQADLPSLMNFSFQYRRCHTTRAPKTLTDSISLIYFYEQAYTVLVMLWKKKTNSFCLPLKCSYPTCSWNESLMHLSLRRGYSLCNFVTSEGRTNCWGC